MLLTKREWTALCGRVSALEEKLAEREDEDGGFMEAVAGILGYDYTAAERRREDES